MSLSRATALLALVIPMSASAQSNVELRGQGSMVTTWRGAPNHAFYALRNAGSTPARVRIVSAVSLFEGAREPLSVRAVLRQYGHESKISKEKYPASGRPLDHDLYLFHLALGGEQSQ